MECRRKRNRQCSSRSNGCPHHSEQQHRRSTWCPWLTARRGVCSFPPSLHPSSPECPSRLANAQMPRGTWRYRIADRPIRSTTPPTSMSHWFARRCRRCKTGSRCYCRRTRPKHVPVSVVSNPWSHGAMFVCWTALIEPPTSRRFRTHGPGEVARSHSRPRKRTHQGRGTRGVHKARTSSRCHLRPTRRSLQRKACTCSGWMTLAGTLTHVPRRTSRMQSQTRDQCPS